MSFFKWGINAINSLHTKKSDTPKDANAIYSMQVVDLNHCATMPNELKDIMIYLHGRPKKMPHQNSFYSSGYCISSKYNVIQEKLVETVTLYGRKANTTCSVVSVYMNVKVRIIVIVLNDVSDKETTLLELNKPSTTEVVMYYLKEIAKLDEKENKTIPTIIVGDFLCPIQSNEVISLTSNDEIKEKMKQETLSNDDLTLICSLLHSNDVQEVKHYLNNKDRIGAVLRSRIIALSMVEDIMDSLTRCVVPELFNRYINDVLQLLMKVTAIANSSKTYSKVLEFVDQYTLSVHHRFGLEFEGILIYYQLVRGIIDYSGIQLTTDAFINVLTGKALKLTFNDINWLTTELPSLRSFEIQSKLNTSFETVCSYFMMHNVEIEKKIVTKDTVHFFYSKMSIITYNQTNHVYTISLML